MSQRLNPRPLRAIGCSVVLAVAAALIPWGMRPNPAGVVVDDPLRPRGATPEILHNAPADLRVEVLPAPVRPRYHELAIAHFIEVAGAGLAIIANVAIVWIAFQRPKEPDQEKIAAPPKAVREEDAQPK